jgi:hypothetical protein
VDRPSGHHQASVGIQIKGEEPLPRRMARRAFSCSLALIITAVTILAALQPAMAPEGPGGSSTAAPATIPSQTTSATTSISDPLPAARDSAGMVYDANAGYFLMFGGINRTGCPSGGSCGPTAYLDDTWTFANGVWKMLNLAIHPSARTEVGMGYDSATGKVILFGGIFANGYNFNDTWEFYKGAWTNITSTAGSPPPRHGQAMVYDAEDGYVLMFGGAHQAKGGQPAIGDTWRFNGFWGQVGSCGGPSQPSCGSSAPSPRYHSSIAYDTADQEVVLFGGTDYAGNERADTWTYVGSTWTNMTAASAATPPHQSGASMAYSSALKHVVMFGGQIAAPTVTFTNSTWEWQSGTWTLLKPSDSPSARGSAAMAYNSSGGFLLLFGGKCLPAPTCDSNNTWEYLSDFWAEIPLANPPSRYDGMMAYDTADGYLVLFGGAPGSGCGTAPVRLCNDTWKFSGGVWTNITPRISPPARWEAGMTYDGKDGYVLLFGGLGISGYLADTWKFTRGVWTNITTSPSPLPRDGMGLAYDAADGYTLLFGGYCPQCSGGHAGDTWEFSGGSWTQVTPTASPSARNSMMMTYDTKDGYILMFGGDGCAPAFCTSETWKFVGGAWTNITTTPAPLGRYVAVMKYDSSAGYVILYGGCHALSSPCNLSDTWKFVSGLWTNISGSVGSMPAQAGPMLSFDPKDNIAVLLGNVYYPYTWAFWNGKWTEL